MKYLVVMLALFCQNASAEVAYVAVASNFSAPARDIAARFTAATGYHTKLSFGSTGKLYAQISQGAPFQVLLAADAQRPQRLESEGLAVANSRFTYALGQLALYSARPGTIDESAGALFDPGIQRLAIANPDTAPYGAAAVEVMKNLGVYGQLQGKLVRGENIAQTWQFVATGNARLGFVSLAQLRPGLGGSWWLVPGELHQPIRQQAILLKKGETSRAARSFHTFMRQQPAQDIMRSYGYRVENG